MASIGLAYIISAYKLPGQVVRLIQRLNAPGASFFVHVDKKAPRNVSSEIFGSLAHMPNVHRLKQHSCYWGGFGHVAATLEGIKLVLARPVEFDYAILLTGQDYPIKSPLNIAQHLQANSGRSFLEHHPLPSAEWENQGMDRVRAWHVYARGRHLRFPPRNFPLLARPLPRRWNLFGGSSYWCLPRACVEHIWNYVRDHPDFVRYFMYVDVPDELFFQTLVMNSPFRDTVVDDNLRYIDWKDQNAASPAVLTMADYPSLTTSAKFFARKFDVTVCPEVLDHIDNDILTDF